MAFLTVPPKLVPSSDGQLVARNPVDLPFMAPRLQGFWRADGRLELALWGAGDVAGLRLQPLAGTASYGPNLVQGAGLALFVAQSAPALVIRGATLRAIMPALRRAPWDKKPHAPARRLVEAGATRLELDWACLAVEQRGDDLIIAVGGDRDELQAALLLHPDEIVAQANAHALRCDQLPTAVPMLRSMVQHGTHVALASIRRDRRGAFAGLAAGLAYSAPARTYFRDGYWTAQILLRLAPDVVRDQIELLSGAVRDDGEAPSGVIFKDDRGAIRDVRQTQPASVSRHKLDWWSDHFDSPLFFILLLGDYVRTTGDDGQLERYWPQVRAILHRYEGFGGTSGLPSKPFNDRDWADNVFRSGLVAYDLGLWIGALRAAAELGRNLDPTFAKQAAQRVHQSLPKIAALWTGRWFADYTPPNGEPEAHLALDSLTLLRFDAVSPEHGDQVLQAVRSNLESRRNSLQRWGDWGMMCAFPPFSRRKELRAKSAFAFRYHNGADWPWLDAVYAQERLRRGMGGWHYPLMRWWEVSLAEGWAAPVEYYSPPFAHGSLMQGWSSLPACVVLDHAETVLAGDFDL